MKTTHHLLLVFIGSALLGVSTHARTQGPAHSARAKGDSSAVNCSGSVTDAAGKPVAGATVEYWRYQGVPLRPKLELKQRLTTGGDGAFSFQASRGMGFLLARKPGLAPAWKRLASMVGLVPGPGEKLVLTTPAAIEGSVVDENGKPVAHARVSVSAALGKMPQEEGSPAMNYLGGEPARDCFETQTDAAGHFSISDFPTNATAALAVEAPGLALRPPEQPRRFYAGFASLPWRAGQKDIKLVVEPAGKIEGRIVVEGSKKAPPVAQLSVQPQFATMGYAFGPAEREPVKSSADGTFHIDDVPPGDCVIRAVFGTNGLPDWVAETVTAKVLSGQTTRGVVMKAIRGGVLEASVLRETDSQPLAGVDVSAARQGYQSSAVSGAKGIALLRLPPGDYSVMAGQEATLSYQTRASVSAGETNHVELDIIPPIRVTGVVHEPDGRAAADAPIWMVGGGMGAGVAAKTDANGKFKVEWNPRRFGQGAATMALLVRDVEHNLAAAQDVEEDTGPVDLKLAPALTVVGSAECNGKPVTNATAALVFWAGQSGAWLQGLAKSTTPGHFEIPALPPGRRYGIVVSAPGCGQQESYDIGASAEPGRQVLDPVELKLANLKLSGQVLDANDKPVEGAFVNLNGEGQPSAGAQTDSNGRFQFEHVCEGSARLFANARNSFGSATAQGGDTNVVLRLGQNASGFPAASIHHLRGKVTDAQGKPVAGAELKAFPGFNSEWVKTQSDGTYRLTWSLQPWQAQAGGALLLVRDPARHLAASADLSEDTTNLNVRLKPAMTLGGRVEEVDGKPLPGAQVGVWVKAGNTFEQLDQDLVPSNTQGRYELKCLPTDPQCIVFASASGHGRSQQQVENDSGTNYMELPPFTLKVADRVVAGQVMDENDKPVSGANVNLNGEGQPNGYMTTDSKGRFHFRVCEGSLRLFASSQAGFAQASAQGGDTNVVITLRSRNNSFRPATQRMALRGQPLPDLTSVHLSAASAPAGKPVLLCLFDAGQRPSRHVVHLLEVQAPGLRQRHISVIAVQSVATSDAIFDAWKSASPVSFPVGRVTEKSGKTRWATSASTLPWLILTDATHRVIAEGFSLDDLESQLKKMRN